MRPPNPQPKRFLLCHSPKDADGKAELIAHVAPARGSVSLWTVDEVLPGDPVREAVESVAKGAEAALLLLSADFFKELDEPRFAEQIEELRRQHKEHGLRLVPILWRPCDWQAESWLAKLKPLSAQGAAFASLDKAQRDQALAEISQQLGGRGRVGVRGFLGALRPEARVVMPDRATLIAKSQSLLSISEADFEKAVDLALGIKQVPQLVRAQHVPHAGARQPGEGRPLEEGLLDYVLRVERLLLVGQPGSGKTQTLRTLCVQLLEVASRDPGLPVPFMVNMSTFSHYRGSLREWLAEGLKECAAIPLAIGKALLEQGQLFLLLDGLDEMAAQRRGRALSELNELVDDADPALAMCIICSRTLEYVEAGVPLMLPAALEVQPLQPYQVREAVEQAGPLAASLRTAMEKDQTLETLLQTPLLWSVAVRAFLGTPYLAPASSASPELRDRLYDAYAVQMLRRTITNKAQQATLMLRWLRWLAQQLNQEQSSLFMIERMQPELVTAKRTYRFVWRLVRGLAFGVGLELILVPLIERAPLGLILGICIGLIFGLVDGFVSGWAARWPADKIVSVEHLRWTMSQTARLWKSHLENALVWGIGFAFVAFIEGISKLARSPLAQLIGGLYCILHYGIPASLVILAVCFYLGGWTKALHTQTIRPNEGIYSSIRNGFREGMGTGLFFGVLTALSCTTISSQGGRVAFNQGEILSIALFIAVIVGVVVVLRGGLGEALKHYVLRFFLWREGKLPLRLIPWLEFCRARLLLRRQGGAYLFWHKTLQDYFAELDDVRMAELAKRIEAKSEYVQNY